MSEPSEEKPAQPERVFFRTPAGRLKSVPSGSIKQAQEAGWTQETPEETAQRRSPSALGAYGRSALAGFGDLALAAPKLITSLAAQLPGAAPDPLADVNGRSVMADTGIAKASTLRADVQAHPIASTLGEITGQIPGLALGGGALEGASVGAASRLGMVGHAAHLAGEVGASVLTGAALNNTAASEEAWVKNEKLTAEASMAAIKMGGFFGLATPFAIKGAGKAFGAVKRAITGTGEAVASEGAHVAEAALAEGGEAAGHEAGAIGSVPDTWVNRQLAKAGAIGDEKAVDAITRGKVSMLRKMPGAVDGIASVEAKREVGEALHDLKIVRPGYDAADMASAAAEARQTAGNQMGDIARLMDERAPYVNGTKVVNAIEDLATNLETQSSKRLGIADARKAANALRNHLRSIAPEAENGILTHTQLHEFRMQLDDTAKWATSKGIAPESVVGAIRKARGIVSDTLGAEIKASDPKLGEAWKIANRNYGIAKWAQKTATANASVSPGTRMGITDYITGAGLLASGHPIAAAGVVGGKKLIQERGTTTIAYMLKQMAASAIDPASAPSAATKLSRTLQSFGVHTAEAADMAIKGFLKGERSAIPGLVSDTLALGVKGVKAAARAAEHSTRAATELGTHHGLEHAVAHVTGEGGERGTEGAAHHVGQRFAAAQSMASMLRSSNINEARAAYAKHGEDLNLVSSNPQIATDRIQKVTGTQLPAIAPKLHGEMIDVAGRATQYLQAHMPAPVSDPNSITPHVKGQPPISDTDLRVYANRVEGVENPLSLFEDVRRGKYSPEKVDAVKTVYPALYAQMRQMLLANLAEQKGPVSYDRRRLLELTFGGDGSLEHSMAPGFMATMRQVGTQSQSQQPGKKPGGPAPQASKQLAPMSAQITGAMK